MRQKRTRPVQVHVVSQRKLGGSLRAVPGHLQLLGSPSLDKLDLLADFHVSRSGHLLLFGRCDGSVLPLPGDISRELQHLVFGELALEPERAAILRPEKHVAGQTRLDAVRFHDTRLPVDDVLATR